VGALGGCTAADDSFGASDRRRRERIAALKESLAANQAALKQYSWVETTAISMKGEVKKQEQKQCSYGADGKEAVIENKVEDLKDYMERVAGKGRKPGDSLSIAFDSALKLSSYNSTSYVEKPKEDDDVTLAVTFGKLPDGTAFPQQAARNASSDDRQFVEEARFERNRRGVSRRSKVARVRMTTSVALAAAATRARRHEQ
jgi:hypothetical protein